MKNLFFTITLLFISIVIYGQVPMPINVSSLPYSEGRLEDVRINISVGTFSLVADSTYTGPVGNVGFTGYTVDSIEVGDLLFSDTELYHIDSIEIVTPGSIAMLWVTYLPGTVGSNAPPSMGRGMIVRPTENLGLLLLTQNGSDFITEEQEAKALTHNFLIIDEILAFIDNTNIYNSDGTLDSIRTVDMDSLSIYWEDPSFYSIGSNNTGSNNMYEVAIGEFNTNDGEMTFTSGLLNEASNAGAWAVGESNISSNIYSYSFGSGNWNHGTNSMLIGNNLIDSSRHSLTIGHRNFTYPYTESTPYSPLNRVFTIGDGFQQNRSNAFIVYRGSQPGNSRTYLNPYQDITVPDQTLRIGGDVRIDNRNYTPFRMAGFTSDGVIGEINFGDEFVIDGDTIRVDIQTGDTLNIYNSNGTLTDGIRTLNMGDGTLNFNNGTFRVNQLIGQSDSRLFIVSNNVGQERLIVNNNNVGVNTANPASRFHVSEGALLVSGTTGVVPMAGAGTRMFFAPQKRAFRVGAVTGTSWNNASVGEGSFAFGANTTASGAESFVGGVSNIGSEKYSSIINGFNNVASKEASLVGNGVENTASGDNSTVLNGLDNTASGDFSTVINGIGNVSPSYGEVILGLNSLPYTPISAIEYQNTDRIFTIGNGTGNAVDRSNALVVYKGGKNNSKTFLNPGSILTVPTQTMRIGGNLRVDSLLVTPTKLSGWDINNEITEVKLGADFEFQGDTLVYTGSTGGGLNLYNADSTLASDRIVTMDSKWIEWKGGDVYNTGFIVNHPSGSSGATGIQNLWYHTKGSMYGGLASDSDIFVPDSIGDYSFSWGSDNHPKGDNSAAFGTNNKSVLANSFTAGNNNLNDANAGVVLGNNNTLVATGLGRVVLGTTNNVDQGLVAIGTGNTVSGLSSIALGQNIDITAANSYAIGFNHDLNAAQSSTLGYRNETSGAGPFLGVTMIGNNLRSTQSETTIVGRFNVIHSSDGLDRKFVIGSGVNSASRRDGYIMYRVANNDVRHFFSPLTDPSLPETTVKVGGDIQVDELTATPNSIAAWSSNNIATKIPLGGDFDIVNDTLVFAGTGGIPIIAESTIGDTLSFAGCGSAMPGAGNFTLLPVGSSFKDIDTIVIHKTGFNNADFLENGNEIMIQDTSQKLYYSIFRIKGLVETANEWKVAVYPFIGNLSCGSTQGNIQMSNKEYAFHIVPQTVFPFETEAVACAAVDFQRPKVYGTHSSPCTTGITETLTGAKLGVVQKIYHESSTMPTVPSGWVLLGNTQYNTSKLNIIYAEWVGGNRVEYWITQEN